MENKSNKGSKIDIFKILTETSEKESKKQRDELFETLHVKEIFTEGKIAINKRTCEGVSCKLCIKACPTNALFWRGGEVGIIKELCIYCEACVLSCMIDDCITITRKRLTGEVEHFSRLAEVMTLRNCFNTKKRVERVKDLFREKEEHSERLK